MLRKTIAKEIKYKGIGLHKGNMINIKLIPAVVNTGIVFKRVDMEKDKNLIIMDLANTFDLIRGTNLKNEYSAKIHTIEHFLSVLNVFQITDLIVEIDDNEIPICDGSAKIFSELINSVGTTNLDSSIEELIITKSVFLNSDDKHIVALPYDGFKITYIIKFNHTFLKTQMFEIDINRENYLKEIAPARTFGFDYEVEYLKKNNLALGGTLENAIVINHNGVENRDGLRFEDEFVRHKILDLIGDLKVMNIPFRGHIIAIKSGHALNIEFSKLLKNQY